ncbi:MAG TPA: nicotinamide riboside transporter PnuC [Gemmatimonadaceae bacterium]|jgi:nicotinamide mononucleotide transporter|nr:nicotinamide riboside transporter PnuC [Gemmatimonadaceae bacterium]
MTTINAFCDWLVAHGSTCVELIGVVLGIVTVYLNARENVWCWPTALVNAAMFVIVFFRTGLYSDFGLQIIYFVLSLYGWYEWLYGGANHSELHVTRTPARLWLIFVMIGLVSWAALSTITSRLPHAALPYMDSALVTVSLIAQYMMTKKYLENWILWIVVDVFYVGMFIYKKLNLTAFNYLVYLALAFVGYAAWRRSLAEQSAVVASPAT